MDLRGKTAIVTGGTKGIGGAIAEALLREGVTVCIAARHIHGADLAFENLRREGIGHAFIFPCDVRDYDQVKALVDYTVRQLAGLDILINNAGGLVRRVPIADLDDAFFDQVMDLNVRSLVAACSAAIPRMREGGHGNIINVTSIAARHGGGSGAVLYASAKGFVSTFTRGLAKEVVKDGIRVNAVSPGVITTPFHERYSTPQMLESFKSTIPMGRLGTADECVGAFLYLASDALSGYVTGQILEVNGGQLMP